jgi:hypothetical protein
MVNGKLVLAIDFDGTIATLSFPEVGTLRKDADVIIRKLHAEGHYIIINTCRSGRYQGMAEDFLKKHSIPYHFVNCNLPELIVEYGSDCRKISADYYIDDKGIGGLPCWEDIHYIIQDELRHKAFNEHK